MSLIKSKGSFDRSMAAPEQDLARSLRRLKRRLFLEQVGAPLPASLQEKPKMIMRNTSEGTEVSYSSSPTISATSPIRAALLAAAAREEESQPSAVTAE
ncbi:MAG: hypothetical protein SGARI_003100 [Bacillariaceae sp.]